MEPIFDRQGEVAGWLERSVIYAADGRPRAFIRGKAVYSFAPEHRGWFMDGYLRDDHGAAVAWTRRAEGSPPRPPMRLLPACPYLQFASLPMLPPLPPLRPTPARTWSETAWDEYLGRDLLRAQEDHGSPPTIADIAHLIAEAEERRHEAGRAPAREGWVPGARPPVVVLRPSW